MAYLKLQPTRALKVIPSDDANIPYPAISVTGAAAAPVNPNELVDLTKDFSTLAVYAGDIVYNLSVPAAATIINNPLASSPNTLLLNASIMNAGDNYIIYQSSPQAGALNSGCVLYVGTGADVTVITAGGDLVTLVNVQNGSYIPIEVIKVLSSTTAQDIIALW